MGTQVHVLAMLALALGLGAPQCLSFPICNSFHKLTEGLLILYHCLAQAHKKAQGGLQAFVHAVENYPNLLSFTYFPLLSPQHPSILAEQCFLPQAFLGREPSSQWVLLH